MDEGEARMDIFPSKLPEDKPLALTFYPVWTLSGRFHILGSRVISRVRSLSLTFFGPGKANVNVKRLKWNHVRILQQNCAIEIKCLNHNNVKNIWL